LWRQSCCLSLSVLLFSTVSLRRRRARVLLAPEFAAPFAAGSLGRTICGLAAAAMHGTRLRPGESARHVFSGGLRPNAYPARVGHLIPIGTQVPFENLRDDLKGWVNQKDTCSVVLRRFFSIRVARFFDETSAWTSRAVSPQFADFLDIARASIRPVMSPWCCENVGLYQGLLHALSRINFGLDRY
jgi:hypothetical protein